MDSKRLIDKYLPVDYSDRITGRAVHETDVGTLFHLMFEDFPGPVRFLLKLRDTLVKPLGLKVNTSFRDHIIERNLFDKPSAEPSLLGLCRGEKSGAKANENEIIVGMDDRHLGFWVSIFVSDTCDLEVRTAVRFHNSLGRIYFAGIWCFHKLIVAGVFRRALKRINAANYDISS